MDELVSLSGIKTLADTGFTFIFGLAALYASGLLAKYITKSIDQKEKQIAEERQARDALSKQTLEVVRNNTDGFRELISKLTDFMQEGRLHHKEVMTHLAHLASDNGFTQKPRYGKKAK